MRQRITYKMKCEYCQVNKEFTARDVGVHEDLTDKDIRQMMNM